MREALRESERENVYGRLQSKTEARTVVVSERLVARCPTIPGSLLLTEMKSTKVQNPRRQRVDIAHVLILYARA